MDEDTNVVPDVITGEMNVTFFDMATLVGDITVVLDVTVVIIIDIATLVDHIIFMGDDIATIVDEITRARVIGVLIANILTDVNLMTINQW